jgi:hypothetical protein
MLNFGERKCIKNNNMEFTLENFIKLTIKLTIALLLLGWLYLFAKPFVSTLNAGNSVKQAFINGFNWKFNLASLPVIGIVVAWFWLKNLLPSSRD